MNWGSFPECTELMPPIDDFSNSLLAITFASLGRIPRHEYHYQVFSLEVYDTLADLHVMYRFHPAPQPMAQMATCYDREACRRSRGMGGKGERPMAIRVLLLTNEYPPHIYGGAGVHVEFLARELAQLTPVEVRTFGTEDEVQGQLRVRGFQPHSAPVVASPPGFASPLQALSTCLAFAGQGLEADVVHCHTWYTHFGGIVAKILYGLPLVITVHSLEPLRPWKREQLGRGYDLSAWIEKTALEMADAIIAVSSSTAKEGTPLFAVDPGRVTVIPIGIDTTEYRPVTDPDCLTAYGIDLAHPYVLFLGRMTQQKGLRYLLEAIPCVAPEVQVVLCAGAADTPAMAQE